MPEGNRISEWFFSKIPMLMGLIYLSLFSASSLFDTATLKLILLLLCTSIGFASVGYWINDWFDRTKDRIAGKTNLFNGKKTAVGGFMLVSFIMAICPWGFLEGSWQIYTLLGVQAGMFVVYAAPPLRIKERGWLGIFTDSLYSSVVPALILLMAVKLHCEQTLSIDLWELMLLVYFSLSGIRKIIAHQLLDADDDKKSGTQTLAVQIGTAKLDGINKRVVVLLELVSFTVMAVFIAPLSVKLALGIVLFLILRLTFSPIGEGIIKYHPEGSKLVNRSLNASQEIDLPLLTLVVLGLMDRWYFLVLFVHLIIFLPGYMQVVNVGKDYVAKPLYYRGILGFYHFVFLRMYFDGILTLYQELIRKPIIWAYYNILWRIISWFWHLGYFAINGKWQKSEEKKG